jgi:hypothetical protein
MASVAQTDKRTEQIAGSIGFIASNLEHRLEEINKTMAILAGQIAQAELRRDSLRKLLDAVKGDD